VTFFGIFKIDIQNKSGKVLPKSGSVKVFALKAGAGKDDCGATTVNSTHFSPQYTQNTGTLAENAVHNPVIDYKLGRGVPTNFPTIE
jgi:hypothetical protein